MELSQRAIALRLAIFFNLSTPIHWTFVICIEEHV